MLKFQTINQPQYKKWGGNLTQLKISQFRDKISTKRKTNYRYFFKIVIFHHLHAKKNEILKFLINDFILLFYFIDYQKYKNHYNNLLNEYVLYFCIIIKY